MNRFTYLNRELFSLAQGVQISEDVLYMLKAQLPLATVKKHMYMYMYAYKDTETYVDWRLMLDVQCIERDSGYIFMASLLTHALPT